MVSTKLVSMYVKTADAICNSLSYNMGLLLSAAQRLSLRTFSLQLVETKENISRMFLAVTLAYDLRLLVFKNETKTSLWPNKRLPIS